MTKSTPVVGVFLVLLLLTVVALFGVPATGSSVSLGKTLAAIRELRDADEAGTRSERTVKEPRNVSLMEAGAAASMLAGSTIEANDGANEMGDTKTGYVYMHPQQRTFTFCRGEVTSKANPFCSNSGAPVASALMKFSLKTSGWEELTLTTSSQYTDLDQAYAAGFLEGALSANHIDAFAEAWVRHKYKPTVRANIDKFIEANEKYMRSNIAQYGRTQTAKDNRGQYWFQMNLILSQMDGVLAGYNMHTTGKKMLKNDMWLINDDGDILDIERLVSPGMRFKQVSDMSVSETYSFLELQGRCTAIVKWTGDDILLGHSTWSDFRELFKVYKHYNFGFQSVVAKKSSHSSYPGMIYSSDDFYVLDSGLAIVETTINILNEKLYSKCMPDSTVMAFFRSMVANRLARSAPEWVAFFSKHNSGTYNNQWMVVDYNKFSPNSKSLLPDTFWVIEQIPGRIVAKDMTPHLQKTTYWGSYNRPYFKKINEESMFKSYAAAHGEKFSYGTTPRAKIIAREQVKIKGPTDMERALRLNDYQTDSLSEGCPYHAIASRFDLPALPQCKFKIKLRANGATDAKFTSSNWWRQQMSRAVAGPTNQGQAPFSWSTSGNGQFLKMKPQGLPDSYSFQWMTMIPATIPPAPFQSKSATTMPSGFKDVTTKKVATTMTVATPPVVKQAASASAPVAPVNPVTPSAAIKKSLLSETSEISATQDENSDKQDENDDNVDNEEDKEDTRPNRQSALIARLKHQLEEEE